MIPLLKQHGITTFQFYRYYFDGSMIRLSSHVDWTIQYYKKEYFNTTTVPLDYLAHQLNYFIWQVDDCHDMLQDCAVNYDIANGISITERNIDSLDFYTFATEKGNKSIINSFYLNNLDLLRNYCRVFKDKAGKLLAESKEYKICTADTIARANTQKSYLDTLGNKILPPQQYQCASLLLQGKTAKQIAREINLSFRTVEAHIESMKSNLGCANKTELILCLMNRVI